MGIIVLYSLSAEATLQNAPHNAGHRFMNVGSYPISLPFPGAVQETSVL